jgi:hypothetical protein
MNSQPEQDLQLRQEQLEAEINPPPEMPTIISQSQTPEQLQTYSLPTAQSQLERCFNWFNSLSGLGKLIVIGVAAIVGIAILRAVLKLVAAVISLTILAVLLYLAYQFFLVRNTETKE